MSKSQNERQPTAGNAAAPVAEEESALPLNPLLVTNLPERSEQSLRRPSSELARATRPAFLNNGQSPVEWSEADWAHMEDNREDIFDRAAIMEQLDPTSFLRDGYAVFERIMKPAAIALWTAALKHGQTFNDTLLTADWSEVDWPGLGRDQPEQFLTTPEIAAALGTSQKVPHSTDRAGARTLRQHSVFAEYFPAGHVAFLMNVLTHPQMLELQQLCLGCDNIYFDHNQLLTRPGGYAGGPWHSHKIGGGHDDCGVATLEEYRAQPNMVLNLCYPEGFAAADDGGLKIIRGSHLYRDADCRAVDDEAMQTGWMSGRLHPVTGAPLKIEHLELPPGSVVCCLSHAAHAVASKAAGKATRWCSLYCYKKADDVSTVVEPPTAVPPVWALKAQRGELPAVLGELLRPSYDRALTGRSS